MKRTKLLLANVAVCMAAAILLGGCGSAKAPEEVTESEENVELQDGTQQSGEIIASDNLFNGLSEVAFESDENSPIDDKLKELEDLNAEQTTDFPAELTMEDFVAYVTYSGDDSDNEQCIIYKDNESLLTAKVKNAGGEQEKFSGKVSGEDSFLNEVKKLKSDEELNAESASYGLLYFNKDGKVYSCYTRNYFRY